MNWGMFSRSIAVAAILTAAGAFSQAAQAQTSTPAFAARNSCEAACCWIDAKTGDKVDTIPRDSVYTDGHHLQFAYDPSDPNHLTNHGHTYVRRADGCWIDAKTGDKVDTIPRDSVYTDGHHLQFAYDPSDPNHLTNHGHTYVRVPCPPPATPSTPPSPRPPAPPPPPPETPPGDRPEIGSNPWTGPYIGGELIKNWGQVETTETLATTDVVTNQFADSGDPLGGGIVLGWDFRPWESNIVVGPFASFDLMSQTINHNFAGGQFLGTTTDWIMTVGAKAGVEASPGLLIYGLAGASWLNHDLNVHFATAASSNTTTSGFTLGLGGEYQPDSWQLFGHPASVFAQYQHTWWGTANFIRPAASPAFNYGFKREDDTIRLGVNIHLRN